MVPSGEVDSKIQPISYSENSVNSFKRIEDLLFLHAKKPKSSKKIIKSQNKGFKLTPDLISYKQKNEVFGKILKHITTDMNYDELGKKLIQEFGFSEDEAKFYAENFMTKLFLDI